MKFLHVLVTIRLTMQEKKLFVIFLLPSACPGHRLGDADPIVTETVGTDVAD